jgi:4-amino-4-deoxy-L-arabinose transferase-like glycosyltransferase
MARNIIHHDKWFVVNTKALALIQREQIRQGRFVDPTDIDFSTVNRDPNYQPEILEVPGLSILLTGLWSAFGSERYSYVRWLQIVIDTLMVILVYWIALRLTNGNGRIAFVASFLYALWPGAVILAKTPSLDTWAGFFVISALALFLWAQTGNRRMAKLILLGVLIGIGVYFRPYLIFLPVAFALAEMKRRHLRDIVRTVLIPSLVALLFVAPWTARNFADFHRVIPMRIGFGWALWNGLGELPNNFGATDNDTATFRYVHARRPNIQSATIPYDDFLLHQALRAIYHHPLHYLAVTLRRLLFLLPCLLALAWRRKIPAQRILLVATATAVILPYVFVRMEDRDWLPAAFAYLILFAIVIEGALMMRTRRSRIASGDIDPSIDGIREPMSTETR